jgi:hypothetical protein
MPEGKGYSRESKRQAFISAMKAGIKVGTTVKPKKKKMGKLKRRAKELIGGSKTYMPKSSGHKTVRSLALPKLGFRKRKSPNCGEKSDRTDTPHQGNLKRTPR